MSEDTSTPDEIYLSFIEVYDLDEFLDIYGYDPTTEGEPFDESENGE